MAKKGSILLNLLNFSSKKIDSIILKFKDIDHIFNASTNELEGIPYLDSKDIEKIIRNRESQVLEKELKLIEKENIDCLDVFDEDYPSLLNEIDGKPLVLYIKGDRKVLNKLLIAVVGSRMPTIYGISMAQFFSYRLSLLGIGVVSGLARGIDTNAHKSAVKQGVTVAVLGSGLLNIYPRENRKLADFISKNGAVISEFPLLTPPLRENFPRRNRIISGLCKGVLVVEAMLRSGALITARLACEQNREVFALPGQIDSPLSKGTHKLIKEGAKLVESIEDIIEELNLNISDDHEKTSIILNIEEEKIFKYISESKGVTLEELFISSGVKPDIINKTMLNLQLKGLIKEVKPSIFVKNINF